MLKLQEVKQRALHASEMINDKAKEFLGNAEYSEGDRSRNVGNYIWIMLKNQKVRLSAGQPNTIRVQVDRPIWRWADASPFG